MYLKKIFGYIRWSYSCDTAKTFILVLVNKHHPKSATALLKLFVQNHTISLIPVLIEDIIKASKSCTQVSEFANQLDYLGVSESVKDLS